MSSTTATTTEIDRYWELARKSHVYGLYGTERAELRKLSRKTEGAYH